MLLVVVVLCCLAAGLTARALAGPERWHQKVRSQLRPGAAEPTESGFKLLFWWHWAVAVVALAFAVWGLDQIQLSQDELYEAADQAVAALDGTSEQVTQDRIMAAIQNLVPADLAVKELSAKTDDRTTENRYEITKKDEANKDDPDRTAVCVKVLVLERRAEPGDTASYTSASSGPCRE